MYHAGTGVDGFRLVKDEVADAVVDGLSLVVFYGLQGVGVMTDDAVGACINDGSCLSALPRCGFQFMFYAPVWTDNDVRRGVSSTQPADAQAEAVYAFL